MLFREFLFPIHKSVFIHNTFCLPKQYWHDPVHADQYIEKSQFIGEINNEGPNKNASYAENLNKLENFVMVRNTEVNFQFNMFTFFLKKKTLKFSRLKILSFES